MQVSKKCVELLRSFDITGLNSNILIADLEKIQYGILDEKNDSHLDYNNFWHRELSQDILDLKNEWKNKEYSEDLFLILNTNLKQITQNDTTKYSAQMFFPIFVNKKLDGFAIFFKLQGEYVLSSSKAPKTIRNSTL